MNQSLKLAQLTLEYFDRVVELGNAVHGDGYLNLEMLHWFSRSDPCSFLVNPWGPSLPGIYR